MFTNEHIAPGIARLVDVDFEVANYTAKVGVAGRGSRVSGWVKVHLAEVALLKQVADPLRSRLCVNIFMQTKGACGWDVCR